MAKRTIKKSDKEDEVVPNTSEILEPVGFKQTEAKLESVDNILTKVTNIIKKHWLILLLLLLGLGVYEFILLVKDEMNKPKIEEVVPTVTSTDVTDPTPIQEHFVVREYDEQQTDGTWLRILVWSDSVETVNKDYVY